MDLIYVVFCFIAIQFAETTTLGNNQPKFDSTIEKLSDFAMTCLTITQDLPKDFMQLQKDINTKRIEVIKHTDEINLNTTHLAEVRRGEEGLGCVEAQHEHVEDYKRSFMTKVSDCIANAAGQYLEIVEVASNMNSKLTVEINKLLKKWEACNGDNDCQDVVFDRVNKDLQVYKPRIDHLETMVNQFKDVELDVVNSCYLDEVATVNNYCNYYIRKMLDCVEMIGTA